MSQSDLSRRFVLRCAAAATGASVLSGRAAAQGFTKSPQQSARYQDHPNGSQHCANCRQFQPPSSCKVVAGKISPNGWCSIYFAKGSQRVCDEADRSQQVCNKSVYFSKADGSVGNENHSPG